MIGVRSDLLAPIRLPGVRPPKPLLAPAVERSLTPRQRELLEALEGDHDAQVELRSRMLPPRRARPEAREGPLRHGVARTGGRVADVRDAAERYLRPQNRTVGWLIPTGGEDGDYEEDEE